MYCYFHTVSISKGCSLILSKISVRFAKLFYPPRKSDTRDIDSISPNLTNTDQENHP